MEGSDFRVAIVQHPPIMFDRAATMRRATELIDEAVGEGARLIVFPEAFIPGYPDWIWRIAPSEDIHAPIFAELQRNAIDLAQGDLQPLQEVVRRHGVTVVGKTLQNLVFRTIYSYRNAELQLLTQAQGMALSPLTPGEAKLAMERNLEARPQARAWEYWSVRLKKSGEFPKGPKKKKR